MTYEDGTIEIVDVGFKAAEGSDDLEKVSDKVIVYVKWQLIEECKTKNHVSLSCLQTNWTQTKKEAA